MAGLICNQWFDLKCTIIHDKYSIPDNYFCKAVRNRCLYLDTIVSRIMLCFIY